MRLLSTVFSVASLPLAWLAGRRLAGTRGAVAATVLLATSPFAVRYGSEARMYSLVMLLVLAGHLLLDRHLARRTAGSGVAVAVVSGALALTHYWALFLLAVVVVGLLVRARRQRSRADAVAAAWVCGGSLLFVPWLPVFLFQQQHTGTPWAEPAPLDAVLSAAVPWAGGSALLALLLVLLAVAGATCTATRGPRVQLDLRGRPPGRALALVVVGTLLLGLVAGQVSGAAFAPRYSSVVVPPFVLLAALGCARLGSRWLVPVAAVAGLAVAVPQVLTDQRTQAPALAAAVLRAAAPGDVVVYCPDQLGPATSRLLPDWLDQRVYPTGGPPQRVDWVDYAARNRAARPRAFAGALPPGAAVYLVSNNGYRTYEGRCPALESALTTLRGVPTLLVDRDADAYENGRVRRWGPAVVG